MPPQSVGLDEAHNRVNDDECSDQPELRVARVLENANEDVRVALAGIEVQAADELGDDVVEVARNNVEESAGGEERERALQRFEQRDRAQAFF